jgi:hypothetical protein
MNRQNVGITRTTKRVVDQTNDDSTWANAKSELGAIATSQKRN